MKREPVQSSNIVSIGYNAASYTMEVEFNDGRIYQYFDVPENVHDGLMRASSVGGYFHQNVRGQYQYARI